MVKTEINVDIVYNSGFAIEIPERQKKREAFTKAELEKEYNRKIDKNSKEWGNDSIYTIWAREAKIKNMRDWEEGKIVKVYTEYYHSQGMDFGNIYYSDGTMITTCYGYDD